MRWDPLMVHSVHQSCVAFWEFAWILQWVLTECRSRCQGSFPLVAARLAHLVHFRIAREDSDGVLMCWSLLDVLSSRRSALTFVAFEELQKAFDTAWVEGTLVRLHEVGVTGQLWHLMCHFLRDTQSQVRVGASLSAPWQDSGIAQGRVLSHLPCNLLTDTLASNVRQLVPGAASCPIIVSLTSCTLMSWWWRIASTICRCPATLWQCGSGSGASNFAWDPPNLLGPPD